MKGHGIPGIEPATAIGQVGEIAHIDVLPVVPQKVRAASADEDAAILIELVMSHIEPEQMIPCL